MAETLVIIDMQDGFAASKHEFTISEVVKEIKRAKARRAGIVVVEYDGYGPTLYPIKKLLSNYANADFVTKFSNDGSRVVYDSIICNCFDYRKLLVCGVNTDACVYETVDGLSLDLPYSTITVVEAACNSDSSNDFGWIKGLENVILKEMDYVYS